MDAFEFLSANQGPEFETVEIERRGVPKLKFRIRSAPHSDRKALAECIDRNTYQKPRKGFLILPGETWVDCGANVGGFSCLVNVLGARLAASYEAEPVNADLARGNLKLNGYDPSTVVHAAVVPDSHEGDTILLNVNKKPIQARRHSTLLSRRGSVPMEVPVVRWSEFATDRCVKMNIEGSEIAILREMTEPLPEKLVTEWSFDVVRQVDVLREVLAKLEGWYEHVLCSRKIPADLEEWHFFPPNAFIYAWGRK